MSEPCGAPYPRLVADIGGTRARFGCIEHPGAPVGAIATLATSEHATLEDALAAYLAGRAGAAPAAAALGVASPISGDRVVMTNCRWAFSAEGLQRRYGFERLLLLNDFEALAHALPSLPAAELVALGGPSIGTPGAARAVLGPGTGLGVAGLVSVGGRGVPVAGEGGHATLSAGDAAEARVIDWLRGEFGHVSAERVLSGSGLLNLYRASCALAGRQPDLVEPAAVSARALDGSDPHCTQAMEWFFGFLGSVAGDVALTFGARGGVYVAGGVVAQLGDAILRSKFRERSEAKGRYRGYLAEIPTWLIRDPTLAALRGADSALDAAAPGCTKECR